ncbi:MAG: hypothetical protein RBT01_03460 [Anaerolineaceae bacterium]|nr:hypothetical protein [Anaerolineaceae bacterium]
MRSMLSLFKRLLHNYNAVTPFHVAMKVMIAGDFDPFKPDKLLENQLSGIQKQIFILA